jgi:DUF3037 family protein
MERRQFEFFLVRYVPNPVRAEFVNIGIILHDLESIEGTAVIRITRNWKRVLCIDPEADTEMLEALEEDINAQFAEGNESVKVLLSALQQQLSNSLQISEPNVTLGANLAAETDRLMVMYVEPQRSPLVP